MRAFARLLHAEWTKLRTVTGWVVALAAGAAVMVGLGLLSGGQGTCGSCVLPVGPEGQEVRDEFTFVHRSLSGDGSITVRLAAMTGVLPDPDAGAGPAGDGPQRAESGAGKGVPGLAPWAKAGLIIKDGDRDGSAYAAIMMTGAHGVRMQHNYVHDRAGQPGAATAPRWLRLTRAGETVTGEESFDGTAWSTIATVRLKGLPATVQAGLFATSPQYSLLVAGGGVFGDASEATGTFDNVTRQGTWLDEPFPAGPQQVTGSGDIGPAVSGIAGIGTTISQTLVGTFAGLIFVVVIGTLMLTAEYRRGLFRTTVAAAPDRARILAAKAVVIATATFALGVLAAAVVVFLGRQVLRSHGVYLHPASTGTEIRVVAGTGALLALAAVLSLALGAVLRRGSAAVTTGIVVIVLPYLLAMTVLPPVAAQWLLRVTPAAAFAIQQSAVRYPQIDDFYLPINGYFPLPPWAGLAVLAGWTALALAVAVVLVRRRDA